MSVLQHTRNERNLCVSRKIDQTAPTETLSEPRKVLSSEQYYDSLTRFLLGMETKTEFADKSETSPIVDISLMYCAIEDFI